MNIVQVQDQLKNFSQDQLVREMQAPTGNAPQYLVLSEIMRRQRMQQDFAAQQGKDDQGTVAQEAIAAAGVPQGGLASMASAMAPQTDMAGSTGVQAMYAGGPVKKMAKGGAAMTDPAIRAMANRMGMSVEEYLGSVGEEQATRLEQSASARALRERMTGREPQQESFAQRANPSYTEDLTGRFPVTGDSVPAPRVGPMEFGVPLYDTLAARTGALLPDSGISMSGIRGALKDFEQNYTTTTEDFTGPIKEYFNRPPETIRTFDPYTGEALDAPTIGTQFRTGVNSAADIAKSAAGAVASLPTFDMSMGNPYSELTADEMKALADGQMSPAMAASLQASRTAGTVGRVDRDQQGIAAIPTPEEVATEAAAPPVAPVADTPAAGTPTSTAVDNTAPPGGGIASVAGSGAGVGGAGGMSSYEQELMDAINRREKAATQDKWLALAQVGLNLMSSTNPTLGGALGEAGLKGVEAARAARDQYDKDRLDLMGALEQSRLSRAAASAKAAGRASSSGGLGGLSAGMGRLLTQISGDIERLDAFISDTTLRGVSTPQEEVALVDAKAERTAKAGLYNNLLYGQGMSGGAADDGIADLADED
jgi:hypothetical protein